MDRVADRVFRLQHAIKCMQKRCRVIGYVASTLYSGGTSSNKRGLYTKLQGIWGPRDLACTGCPTQGGTYLVVSSLVQCGPASTWAKLEKKFCRGDVLAERSFSGVLVLLFCACRGLL